MKRRRPIDWNALGDRFWKRVAVQFNRHGDPDYSKCWPFLGTCNSGRRNKYGRISIDGKLYKAHRIAFALFYRRQIPAHLDGAHQCDNPPCCNPTHVRPASNRANIAEYLARWRKGDKSRDNRANLEHGKQFRQLTECERVTT